MFSSASAAERRGSALITAAALLGSGVVAACAGEPNAGPAEVGGVELTLQRSGVALRLQAVAAVDERVGWASGLEGTWLRTVDGGVSWSGGVIPGGEELQLRDVEAFSASEAVVLAAGSGEASRIYRTSDGGASWRLQFRNEEPAAFYNCMAFWDRVTGIVFGDSVDGELRLLRTADGESWAPIPPASLPPALPNEGGFAASGTCAIAGIGGGWVGTGNASASRVLVTRDDGLTWRAAETPLVAGEAAGVISLVLAPRGHPVPPDLLALGGVIGEPEARGVRTAVSYDGGIHWSPAGEPALAGPIYGSAAAGSLVLAVGPAGAQLSRDAGATWAAFTEQEHWAVSLAPGGSGWMVGPEGRITRIAPRP